MQQVLSNTNKSLHLLKNPDKNNQETKFDHMSTSGLWSSFEKHNSNENEQEITLVCFDMFKISLVEFKMF